MDQQNSKMDTCINLDIFEDQNYAQNFQCLFGLGVLNDPVCDPCGHTFCKTCITNWMKINRNCPISKQNLTQDSIRPVLALRNCLDNLIVKCQNCSQMMNLQNWKVHVINCEIYSIDNQIQLNQDKQQFFPFIQKILQLKQQIQKLEKKSQSFSGKEDLKLMKITIKDQQTQDFVLKKPIKLQFPFEINLLDFKNLFSDFLNIVTVHTNKTIQNQQKTSFGFQIFTKTREIKILFTISLLSAQFNLSIYENGTEIEFPQQVQLPGKIRDATMFIKFDKKGLNISFKTFPSMTKTFFVQFEQIQETYLYAEKVTLEQYYQLILYYI